MHPPPRRIEARVRRCSRGVRRHQTTPPEVFERLRTIVWCESVVRCPSSSSGPPTPVVQAPSPPPVHTRRGLADFTMEGSVVVVTLVEAVDDGVSSQVRARFSLLRACGRVEDRAASSSTGRWVAPPSSTVAPRRSPRRPRLVHRVVHRSRRRRPHLCPQRVDNCGQACLRPPEGCGRNGGRTTRAPPASVPAGLRGRAAGACCGGVLRGPGEPRAGTAAGQAPACFLMRFVSSVTWL